MIKRILIGLWALTLLPALALTGLRLMSTPTFAYLEYHRPGFVADPYGFNPDDRQFWCLRVLNCVVGDADPDSLSQAQLPPEKLAPGREPGLGHRAFCTRETRHLADVKNLLGRALQVWRVSLILFLGGLLGLRIRGGSRTVWKALRWASSFSLATLTGGLLLSALAGDLVLNQLHQHCFAGQSYLFYTSDTLLRIYPHQYWRDLLLLVVLMSLMACLALYGLSRAYLRPDSPGG